MPKEKLSVAQHGLYRKPRNMNKLDGRRREVRAWKTFCSGITEDLGGQLSFAQHALAEVAFWKYLSLSEFMRTLLLSGKENVALAIMSERNNRQWNATSNSFRMDLIALYGPAGLGKVERRVESLQEYLAKNYPASDGTEPDQDGGGAQVETAAGDGTGGRKARNEDPGN